MAAGSREILPALRSVDLFRAFEDDELALLGEALRETTARDGQVVVREGDEDRALFIVASGRARVVSAGVRLGTISEGQHFGEVALIAGGRRTASVVAEGSARLQVFAERYLLEVPTDHPAQATAERLLSLLERWVTIYPDDVPPTSILREFIGEG